MDVIRNMFESIATPDLATQVLIASIRNPLHVVDTATAGARRATMPFNVLRQLIKHPPTDIGLKKFIDDRQKSGAKI